MLHGVLLIKMATVCVDVMNVIRVCQTTYGLT